MTNYPIGPHRIQLDHIGLHRTTIYIILPLHITLRTGRPRLYADGTAVNMACIILNCILLMGKLLYVSEARRTLTNELVLQTVHE